MFCHLTRWFISKAEDGGKPGPRFAERHATRCEACREYARFTASLSSRLGAEVPSLLDRVPEAAPTLEGVDAGAARSGRLAPYGRRPVALRPFPVASAAMALGALLLVLALAVLRENGLSPADRRAAFAALKTATAAPEELGGAVAGAESSLERERLILEQSILSALDYLQKRLDIKVERRDRQEPL